MMFYILVVRILLKLIEWYFNNNKNRTIHTKGKKRTIGLKWYLHSTFIMNSFKFRFSISLPPCRSPHVSPQEWSECPHYSTDQQNDCFFSENHTTIWTSYSIQLRSRDRAVLYDENSFYVQDIGEFTDRIPWRSRPKSLSHKLVLQQQHDNMKLSKEVSVDETFSNFLYSEELILIK